MISAEDKAWELLLRRSPADVARCALTHADEPSGAFHLATLGTELKLDSSRKTIEPAAPGAGLMKQIGHFWRLTALWYLSSAQDLPLAGRLVAPQELNPGLAFFQGSHTLPLQRLADRFDGRTEDFLQAAGRLGGQRAEYGDAATVIPVFPRIPVTLILWHADEEFPARAQLLFDASVTNHLPVDAVWSAAMMTVLALMNG